MNGFGQFVDVDFALAMSVASGLLFQCGNAAFFIAVQPGADGTPGKLPHLPGVGIGKGLFTDGFNAGTNTTTFGIIYRRQDFQADF